VTGCPSLAMDANTSVRSETHNRVCSESGVFELLLLLDWVIAFDDRAAEGDPVKEIIERLDLGGLGTDSSADLPIGDIAEQEKRPLGPAEFTKALPQSALPVERAELAQQHRWQNQSGLDREDHLHHVSPMGLNQPPVDLLAEERIDVLVADGFSWTIENDVVPIALTRHQHDAKEPAQAENRFALALSIRIKRVGLDRGAVLYLASPGFCRHSSSGGEPECLHSTSVLPFDDEFRKAGA